MADNLTKFNHVMMSINITAGEQIGRIYLSLTLYLHIFNILCSNWQIVSYNFPRIMLMNFAFSLHITWNAHISPATILSIRGREDRRHSSTKQICFWYCQSFTFPLQVSIKLRASFSGILYHPQCTLPAPCLENMEES